MSQVPMDQWLPDVQTIARAKLLADPNFLFFKKGDPVSADMHFALLVDGTDVADRWQEVLPSQHEWYSPSLRPVEFVVERPFVDPAFVKDVFHRQDFRYVHAVDTTYYKVPGHPSARTGRPQLFRIAFYVYRTED